MTLSTSIALLYVVTTVVGAAMTVIGLRHGVLAHRLTRRCPSCGRLLRGAGCRCISAD